VGPRDVEIPRESCSEVVRVVMSTCRLRYTYSGRGVHGLVEDVVSFDLESIWSSRTSRLQKGR
jgi:hypothetical protein